jgi:hypothetical protein
MLAGSLIPSPVSLSLYYAIAKEEAHVAVVDVPHDLAQKMERRMIRQRFRRGFTAAEK